MAASNSTFDSRGRFFGSSSNKYIAEIEGQRNVAMATTFWLSMGYNFSCMIASDSLFDSRGWVFGDNYPMKT